MQILDLMWYKLSKAVKVGSIFFEPKNLPEVLARYSKQLIAKNESESFPYSLIGSSTGLCFRNKRLLFLTKHQLVGRDPSEVGIFPLSSEGKSFITGKKFIDIRIKTDLSDEEFTDIAAIEFDPVDYSITRLQSEFFQVVENELWPNDTLNHFLVFGFPSAFQKLEMSDEVEATKLEHIRFTQLYTSAKYDQASNARHCHRAKLLRNNNFPADGLSGGVVFHIGKNKAGFFIGLGGIIVRGSSSDDDFYFVEGQHLVSYFHSI